MCGPTTVPLNNEKQMMKFCMNMVLPLSSYESNHHNCRCHHQIVIISIQLWILFPTQLKFIVTLQPIMSFVAASFSLLLASLFSLFLELLTLQYFVGRLLLIFCMCNHTISNTNRILWFFFSFLIGATYRFPLVYLCSILFFLVIPHMHFSICISATCAIAISSFPKFT